MAEQSEKAKRRGNARGTFYIVGAIFLAVAVAIIGPASFGESFRPFVTVFDVGGEIFLRMLQMVVVPLVMASVMSGILGLGDIRKLGRPGGYAVTYYLCTTVLAVITGLIVVNIVNPGKGIDKKLVEDARHEGEETIAHVAGRAEGRKVNWHNVTGDRAEASGASQNVMIPEEGTWNVRIIVDQVGNADRPARAQLQWSADGNEFLNVENGEFVAGVDAGIYTTKPVIPLPPDAAGYTRIVFEPGQGGTQRYRSLRGGGRTIDW